VITGCKYCPVSSTHSIVKRATETEKQNLLAMG